MRDEVSVEVATRRPPRAQLSGLARSAPALFLSACFVALVGCKSPYGRAADEFERRACVCRDWECYDNALGDYHAWASGNRASMRGDWRHTGPAEAAAERARECGAPYRPKRCDGGSRSCPPGTECRSKVERSALNPGGDLVFYCLPPAAPAPTP